MTDAKLKSLAARINRLLDEKQELGADIADIFQEAKSSGYVPKVLRKAITRQRMEPAKRQEEDSILELYEAALGNVGKALADVRNGATWKEASKTHDVPRATLARAAAVSKHREVIPEESGDRQSPSWFAALSADVTTASASSSPPHAGEPGAFVEEARRRAELVRAMPDITSPGPIMRELAARYDEPDDLTIPAHLRAVR